MPKYSYLCEKCCKTTQRFEDISTKHIVCPECQGQANRQLPKIGGQEVRETVDSLTGVTWHQDQKEKIAKRKEEHYWEKEIPRLVDKYSLATCLENGWLVYNEKGELVIGKAPSKR